MFLLEINPQEHQNPFHNEAHAAVVCHSTFGAAQDGWRWRCGRMANQKIPREKQPPGCLDGWCSNVVNNGIYLPTATGSWWWFQRFYICTPIWGKIPILTNIFQMGWNHQLGLAGFLFAINVVWMNMDGYGRMANWFFLVGGEHVFFHQCLLQHPHKMIQSPIWWSSCAF